MDFKANRRIYLGDGKMPSVEMRKRLKAHPRHKSDSSAWQAYKRWIKRKTRYAERDEINKEYLS